MSRRRELVRHMASLADIGELLGAMKNLALVESRRIAAFIDAQRMAAGVVRDALSEVLHDHGGLLATERGATTATGARVLCVIGSERGFCGDLNQRLASAAGAAIAAAPERPAIVLVGRRLLDAWPADAPQAEAAIAGASIAEEADTVLAALVAALAPLLTPAARCGTPGLDLLYVGEAGGVGAVHVLPAPLPAATAAGRGHAVALNLPPRALHAALLGQYLETALGTALYDALLHENEARLAHMEQARRRIDERLTELGRRANQARQEEITEEIEIILLAGMLEEEGLRQRSDMVVRVEGSALATRGAGGPRRFATTSAPTQAPPTEQSNG